MSNKLTYTSTANHTNSFSLDRTSFNRMGTEVTAKSTYKDSSQRTRLLSMKSVGSNKKILYSKSDPNVVDFHLSKTRNIGYITPKKANQ